MTTAASRPHSQPSRRLDVVEQLIPVAEEAGMPLIHLAMTFTIAHPGVTSACSAPGPRNSWTAS